MTAYSFRDSNIRKTWAIFSLFLVIVIGVGWIISMAYNDTSILYFAVIFSLVMNLIAYWKSDSIALSLSRAHEADKNTYRDLFNVVENLSITTGIPTPKIYIIEDPSANAFATGRNPKHASIAVTTGLLQRLNKTELEGVIAHEMSHVKNYDILVSTVVVVLVGFITILTDFFMRSLWWRGRDDREGNGSILMIIGIATAILAPILATLIQLAISRKREFLADASGALITRYPEGLVLALEKISSDRPMAHPQNATAHMFFASPFKADAGGQQKTPWFVKLFMTHPPIEDRIKALRQMSQ
jgi:heat shock protein HtpX